MDIGYPESLFSLRDVVLAERHNGRMVGSAEFFEFFFRVCELRSLWKEIDNGRVSGCAGSCC